MKTTKTFKVVMLPTKKECKLTLFNKLEYHSTMDYDPHICNNQHLHIISNEIKNDTGIIKGCKIDDYIIYNDKVSKITSIGEPFNYKGTLEIDNKERVVVSIEKPLKIIATTDKSLKITKDLGEIAREELLPQLPELFIHAYIKNYNDGTIITEVDLEVEKIEEGSEFDLVDGLTKYTKIKIRSDNTVIVHQSKTYSRDEVEKLMVKSFDEGLNRAMEISIGNRKEFHLYKWIEENL